jgi:zinc transport system permease protein
VEGNIFQYEFIIKGLLGAIFASITAGLAGTYIVSKRMVFLSGGITHASFGGIGIGYFAGINPVLGAAVFGILSALGVEYLSVHQKIREDSAIGILWAFGMAIGIIFIYLTPGYTPNLMSYLFGSILTVTNADIIALGIMSVILIFYFGIFYRTILYISFDESFARTYSSFVDIFKYVTTALIALTIVLNIRMAGVILVLSLFTIPPNIAMIFTDYPLVYTGRFYRNCCRICHFLFCRHTCRGDNYIYSCCNMGYCEGYLQDSNEEEGFEVCGVRVEISDFGLKSLEFGV